MNCFIVHQLSTRVDQGERKRRINNKMNSKIIYELINDIQIGVTLILDNHFELESFLLFSCYSILSTPKK